jgi:hypothetical protein
MRGVNIMQVSKKEENFSYMELYLVAAAKLPVRGVNITQLYLRKKKFLAT